METLEQIKTLVEELSVDTTKFFGGNNSAGTRARKSAQDLKKLGVADKVMKEPLGGAQRDHKETYKVVKKGISEALKELQSKKPDALLKERRKKFLELGSKSL